MSTTAETAAAAPEFFSDAHRDAHIRALEREKAGYEQRSAGHARRKQTDEAGYWKSRADEVQDELDRITGDKKPTARGKKKPPDQPDANE